MPKDKKQSKKSTSDDFQSFSITMHRFEVHKKVVQYQCKDDDGDWFEKRNDAPISPQYMDKELFGEDLKDKDFPKKIRVRVAWR